MKYINGDAGLDAVRAGSEQTSPNVVTASNLEIRSILPSVIEELPDAIAIAQVVGSSAPILYVNTAFERLTGYEPSEVLGKDCRYLQGSERGQPEVARIRMAIDAAEPVDVTLRNYRKDGSTFWNALSLRPIAAGAKLFYFGILRDVSALRLTEMALDRPANVDASTGCLNRQSFMVAAEEHVKQHKGSVLSSSSM